MIVFSIRMDEVFMRNLFRLKKTFKGKLNNEVCYTDLQTVECGKIEIHCICEQIAFSFPLYKLNFKQLYTIVTHAK